MQLQALLSSAGYKAPEGIADREITGVTADSRAVREGMLFVAIQGLRHNGFCHLKSATRRGAVFAVCEREAEGIDCLVVPSAREALARLLDAWWGHPARDMTLIGITGTNGKTSTAAMLFAILRAAGHTCGLLGTVECRLNDRVLQAPNGDRLANMTTPDPGELYALLAQMRDGGATHAVMEVTSHALALEKVAPLCFKRAIFTNLTPDHLDFHRDMESYFAEKKKLFSKAEGAVISCLDSYGERLADGLEMPIWRLDQANFCFVRAEGSDGVSFALRGEDGALRFYRLPVPGRFSAENAALAAITALSLGISHEMVEKALSGFAGVRGRMERICCSEGGPVVILDYAHTPDALEKLLRTVRDFSTKEQRILLLFGCGGDRDRSKRAEMGRIGSRLADLLILTSDNCRSEEPADILRDILRGVDKERPYRVIEDRATAITYAVQTARDRDIVILAGKGHEEYEIRGRCRLPFSERRIVEAAMAARGGKHAH